MSKHARVLFVAAAVAVAALTMSAAAPTAVGVDTSALRSAVTVSGIMEHEDALQAIANANGGTRAVETDGFDESVEYVVAQLQAAGYSPTVQNFSYSFFTDSHHRCSSGPHRRRRPMSTASVRTSSPWSGPGAAT